MRVDLGGYAPDADPTTEGVITDCTSMVPTIKGMAGAPSPASTGLAALAAKCLGAAVLRKLDNTTRLFAGTQTALYEAGATTWTDRTRSVGGAYGGGAQSIWRFAQFGNVSLAVQKADVLQASTTGAFANLTAPKATVVETVNQFVFLFDTNEATYGDSPDRWWCCALGDHTDWVPAVATQSATGRLTSSPGPLRAGRRLGNNIVAYKDRAMYIGQYVGAPNIWDWQEVSSEVGAPCQEVVVPITKPNGGMAHIFMGYEDFYYYDGAQPVSIGTNSVRETVFADINRAYGGLSCTVHDRVKGRIYFFYVGAASSGVINKSVVYNYRTQKWGRDDRNIEAGLEYISAGTTYDGLGTLYSTYSDLPAVPYDASFWVSNAPVPAVVDTSHLVKTLDGASTSCDFTTGDIGKEDQMTTFARAGLEYLTAPTTASMTNYYRQNGKGDSLVTDASIAESSRKFDVMRDAKWHRAKFSFTGNIEVDKMVLDIRDSSLE